MRWLPPLRYTAGMISTHRCVACRLVSPFLAVVAAATAVAADAPPRDAYPWEREGPAVPAFEIRPITARPALLIDPTDVADVRRRFEAAPGHPEATPKRMGPTLHALLYGDDQARREATDESGLPVRFFVRAGSASTRPTSII
ncbi:MAG: hypothetical protein EBZ74_02355 [Planctomycetia bacterium]|nr:hypothetical protein [Planctomycetia bacterium]